MSRPEIRKLTAEEIASASPSQKDKPADFSNASAYKSAKNRGDLYSNEYIKKLKLSEVEKFFTPLGYISSAKIPKTLSPMQNGEVADPAFIFVVCEDFSLVFSDYNSVFDFNVPHTENIQEVEKFDMNAFADYCEILGITPEIAIREMMAIELFGNRFPSYGQNYSNVKQKEAELAYEKLPKTMRKKLAPVAEKNELLVDATGYKLKFGAYDALKNYFGQSL